MHKTPWSFTVLAAALLFSFKATFFSLLFEPFYQMTHFVFNEMCSIAVLIVINHSILKVQISHSIGSKPISNFWLALNSEKVTFYLLFKGLIHKAGGLNCCVRPAVSNESHSACLCIHLHVFSAKYDENPLICGQPG